MDINITTGIFPTGQLHLDSKSFVRNISDLQDLGENNYKAFYYPEGLIVYCLSKNLNYQWREEAVVGEMYGLITESYTYPEGVVSNGVDYGGRTFNFFKKTVSENELPGNEDGDTGNPIDTGILYTWTKFAEDENGLNMSDSPAGKTYIGLAYNKILAESEDENSSDASYYFWSLIGETPSYTGADGKTYYIWTKYSTSSNGLEMSDYPEGKTYIGLAYNKETDIESDNPEDYEWSLILGDTSKAPSIVYYWVKFASSANPDPSDMSDDADGKSFMGIATDKESPIKSNNPEDYVWNPISGDQGYTGADGKTYYVWTKFANTNNPIPSEMFDEPGKYKYMGMVSNRETSEESLDYRDYTWTKTSASGGLDQNNKIRTIEIPENELNTLDTQGFADWINLNKIIVDEDEIIALVLAEPIDAPTIPELDEDLTLDLTSGDIDETTAEVFWNDNEDDAIVRFELYIQKTGGSVSMIPFISEETTILENLESGSEYICYILAFDTLGNSKKSNDLFFSTLEVFVPSTPNIILKDIQVDNITLDLSIEDSFGALTFSLYKDDVLYQTFDVSEALGFVVSGLNPETEYTFKVKANNGTIDSLFSSDLSVTTLEEVDPPLTKPTLTAVKRESYSITYNVNTPSLEASRITSLQMQYRKLNQPSWISETLIFEPLQKLDNLDPDTSYQIQVRSTDGSVVSEWSDILLVTTTALVSGVLTLVSEVSQDEYENGFIGAVEFFGGVPETTIRVDFRDEFRIGGVQSIGQIEFERSLEDGGFLNLFQSNRDYLNFDLTLDSNGSYRNAFKLNYNGGFNEEHVFTMSITQAVLEPSISSASITFIDLNEQ